MRQRSYGDAACGHMFALSKWNRREAVHKRRSNMLLWGFLARQFRRWQVYNRTVAELSSLDDRSLADINVSRSEIRAVARHASAVA